jgi:Tfp pilus assembly protein PilO
MRQYLLFIIIFIALSMILIFYLVLPKYEKLSSLDLEILEKSTELRSKEEYSKHLKVISAKIEEKKEAISKIDFALPKESDVPALLNFFQKAASQSGLVLDEVSPRYFPPEEGKKIATTRVGLILTGDYSSLKKFLLIVEKSARLIEVDSVNFSYPKKGEENLFNFNLGTKAYSY